MNSPAETPEADRGDSAGPPAQNSQDGPASLAYEATVLAQLPGDLPTIAPAEPVQASPVQASPVQAEAPAPPTPGSLLGESPSADAPQADTPQADTPQAEAPPADFPSAETDAPRADAPRADAQRADAQRADAQQAPAPSAETPDAAPTQAKFADVLPTAPVEAEPVADDIDRTLDALTALHSRIGDLADAAAELTRLRSRDTDLIARLHDDVTRLRNGEIASALNPVVTGMIKLHDQMVSLGALADPASPVGMLHTQLLQVLELTCAVKPFTPARGERFDASRHTGMKRTPVTDPAADGTVAGTLRVGFARADGSVVRVAEVEVHRLSG